MRNFVAVFYVFSALSWGQSFTGSIRGTVTDSTHAAIPNAKVIAVEPDDRRYPAEERIPAKAERAGGLAENYVESALGERFTYTQAMGGLVTLVFIIAFIVTAAGPEAKGVSFRKERGHGG